MANMFMQPGLGELYQRQLDRASRRQADALNRQLIQSQIAAQQAKAAQLSDPRYRQSQLPSAIQTAQYYSGLDPEGQRLFRESRGGAVGDALAKKGLTYDPASRQVTPMQRFGSSLGQIGAEEIAAKAPAEVERARSLELGKARTAKEVELQELEATLPELESTVKELSQLGKKATYTKSGQFRDALAREAGRTTEGMLARTEYISMVDNQILPLLRQTFGAAFTEGEGERLRETLGDPDKSPKEKDFVLKSFIRQKRKDIKSKRRELGKSDKPEVISYKEYIR